MSADSQSTTHTYHFDLSHVRGNYLNPHVKTPLGTFALKPHTSATRQQAAAENLAVASMPESRRSRLTHYAEGVAVPGKAPFYMRLHADNGDNSTLPILFGVKVTIPHHHVREVRRDDLAFLRRIDPAHFGHFGIRMPGQDAKDDDALDFLADADLVSHLPTDTAGTMAYSHPSMCSTSNRHGTIINDRYIMRSKYLTPFASDVAQLGEATDHGGFAVITQMMDMRGDKPATFRPFFEAGGKTTSDVIHTYEISTDFTGTQPTKSDPARPPKYQTGAQLIGSALGGVTNDPRLRNTHWSVNQGHQTARYDAGVTNKGLVDRKRLKSGVSRRAMAANAATPSTGGYEFTINNKTPGHGLQVDTSSIAFDTTTNMFSIDVKNTFMRTLATHVRFYDSDGTAINQPPSAYPDLQKIFQEIKEILHLDTEEEFLQFVYSVYAIMDIPMPFGATTVAMLWPENAESADILFGGIGTSKWDATADMLGVVATALFQYLVPLMMIPVGAWIEKSTYYKKLMENKGVATLVALVAFVVITLVASIFGEGKTSAHFMINYAINKLLPALLSEGFDWILKAGLKKLLLEGVDVVIGYVSVKVVVSEMIDAIPFAGWAAAALGIAATVGALGETTAEVLCSPATYTLNVTRALEVTATVSPDPLHGTTTIPAIWPDSATHFKAVLQYKNGTAYTVTGALPVEQSERSAPITVTFDQIPSGGDFQITFGVYSNSDWLAGNWTSAWISAVLPAGKTVLAITGSIIENLVPLTAQTQYLYNSKIGYTQSLGHQWQAGNQPTAVLSNLNPKGLDQLVSITANNGAYMLGYVWQAANQNVPLFGTSTPTDGLVYTFQNINMLSDPEASLKFSGVGFSSATFLAYEQFGPEPLFAAPSSVVSDLENNQIDATLVATFTAAGYPLPENLSTVVLTTVEATVEWTITLPNSNAPTYQLNRQSDGSVFVYLYPTDTVGQNNFYLQNPAGTDSSQLRQLRKVILDNTTPFDMNQTTSCGAFATQTLDALVIHPANYAVGVSYSNHYMEIVPILQTAVADADAQAGTIVSGPGIRQGLMLGPCAVAVTQDGRILVLEAINQRIQAFDINGNPVPSFQKAVVATLAAATYAPDLDAGLISLPLRDAFAAGGYALSQHWQLRDSTNLVDVQLAGNGMLQLALNGAPLSNQWTITNTDETVYPAVLSADAITVTNTDGSTFTMPSTESADLDMGIVGVASIEAFYKAGIVLAQQAVAAGNGLYVSPSDCESDLCQEIIPAAITTALATVFVTMAAGTEVLSIVTNTVQALDTVWLISDPEAARTYQIEVSATDNTQLTAIELNPFMHLQVNGMQKARLTDYHPNDLADLQAAAETSDEKYLDLATEMKGYMYVLGYTGTGAQVSNYFLDLYDPLGNFLSRTPDTSLAPTATGVNVGRLAIDMWRNMYGLDYEAIAGPGGRVEPSVSLWVPTTPTG